jgi:AcrR family transcriptional regulator
MGVSTTPAVGLEPTAPPTARGEARRQAILDAAAELFLEHGFEGVSMSEVVQRAGGSLATLYRLFGSKEGLFEAILAEVSNEIVAPLLDEEIDKRPPDEALRRVGESFLSRVLAPDALAWHRLVLADGSKHPELRAALLRIGPGRVRERLSLYLERQARSGRLRVADPKLAASQFLALVKASVHLEMMCGEPVATDPASIRSHVCHAVDLFLHGCAI